MQNELNDLLTKAKELLKEETTKISYETWIKVLEIQSEDNGHIVLLTSTDFQKNVVSSKYLDLLTNTFNYLTNKDCTVSIVSREELEAASNNADLRDATSIEAPINYATTNLNPKYTFSTFVVGNNNRFAHSASLAVAESPGEAYNPLYIYGGPGLGKTHLMHSIGHFILNQNPDAKVIYVTSEEFTNEVIESIRNGNASSMTKFRDKYRKVDVLMIDDIQFLIGKESTQEEFFHTFNYLYETGKQVIITSDKPPKDFTNLEERLRSRFSVGLPVDVSAPDYETRVAILHKKEETENTKISDDIINYIAENINTNIRELEGALNRITAFKRLSNKEITLNMAEDVLRDIINNHKEVTITVPLIVEVIASHFGFEADELLSQKRNKDIAYSRQIAMYLCRQMTDLSLQQIGKELGNRDHTTVRHGIEKITEDLKNSQFLQDTIDVLQKKINPALG